MTSDEQDWPAGHWSAEPASAEDAEDAAGPARAAPAGARSVWAEMLIPGPDDAGEPGPDDAGPPPAYSSPHEGTPGWPSSGLPPSFGQRPAVGERPDFGDPGLPPPRPTHGRHRPVPRQAEPAQPGQAPPGYPEPGWAQPGPAGYGVEAPPGPAGYGVEAPLGPAGYGVEAPPAPDMPQPRRPASPANPFGSSETCAAEAGHGWAVGYGVAGGQDQAGAYAAEAGHGWTVGYGVAGGHDQAGVHAAAPGQSGPGTYGDYGYVAPAETAPGGEPEPTWQTASADSLTADVLLPGRHAAPPSGWRRALYQATGGLVRAPQSAADRRRKDLVLRARTPVAAGHHRVAVLSLKGGVGKTTTTVGLGATLASLRGDRIIAVDANPDRGTLCDKLRLETAATVRDLISEEGDIRRYADVRAFTTQAPSGLEVLASDRDPTVSVALSDQDYADVARVLEHYYSVCITDCGTGLLHSAMAGVLRLSDQIVLVSSPSVDGARSASATLDWLAAHQHGDLVRGAVVVLSAVRPRGKTAVDLGRLEQHFAARCRAVVRVPYDAHLEEGAEVDSAQLGRATADAYLVLAAEVGDGFARPHR